MNRTVDFERIQARLAGPGLAAWVAAAALALSAVVLIPGTETRAYAPALLSTAVLLLATGRFWTVRRLASEIIGLGVGQVATVLVACTALQKPFDLALLPLACLCVIVGIEAANAWRFAPDEGQGNDLWMFTHAFPSCMGPCLGLLVVMPAVLPLIGRQHTSVLVAGLVMSGTLGGRWFQLLWSYMDSKMSSA